MSKLRINVSQKIYDLREGYESRNNVYKQVFDVNFDDGDREELLSELQKYDAEMGIEEVPKVAGKDGKFTKVNPS